MSIRRLLLCPLFVAASVGAAQAGTIWDESLAGDLSSVGASPTPLALTLGSNIVRGVTGRSNGVVDRDYFSFTVQPGWQLDTLTLMAPFTAGVGFIGVQAGPQVTVNPTGNSPAGLLGWVHFSQNDTNTDILGLMGIGFGASGYATPLPSGVYSFWVQDTATGSTAYNFDFGVSAVPEPTTTAFLLAGLAALGVLTGARRNSTLRRR